MTGDGLPRLRVPVHEDDHVRGPATAPITLVEYGDFECPYCGLAYPVVKAVEKRYGPRLRFVYRNFPLPQHPHAYPAAETSEFAEEYDRFWEMHDMLFEHQRALDVPHLLGYAELLGLDPDELLGALRDGRYRALIEEVKQGGIASGVRGTPAFFLNGVLFPADPSVENFSLVIDRLLVPAR